VKSARITAGLPDQKTLQKFTQSFGLKIYIIWQPGCRLFYLELDTVYQMIIKYVYQIAVNMPNPHKLCQHFQFQGSPKLGFLVWKYTIWQPWLAGRFVKSNCFDKFLSPHSSKSRNLHTCGKSLAYFSVIFCSVLCTYFCIPPLLLALFGIRGSATLLLDPVSGSNPLVR
jgi:hypothetical protein